MKAFLGEEMVNNRNRAIDLIKGIGIILLIIGHCIGFFQHETESFLDDLANNIINSFHMPLFFLLGGMIHNYTSINETYARRFSSLIIPLLIYEVFNGVTSIIIHSLCIILQIQESIEELALQTFKIGGGWFLISYYFTCLLIIALYNSIESVKKRSVVVLCLMTVAIVVSSRGDSYGMDSYLITTFVGTFFYHIGVLVVPKIKRISDGNNIVCFIAFRN